LLFVWAFEIGVEVSPAALTLLEAPLPLRPAHVTAVWTAELLVLMSTTLAGMIRISLKRGLLGTRLRALLHAARTALTRLRAWALCDWKRSLADLWSGRCRITCRIRRGLGGSNITPRNKTAAVLSFGRNKGGNIRGTGIFSGLRPLFSFRAGSISCLLLFSHKATRRTLTSGVRFINTYVIKRLGLVSHVRIPKKSAKVEETLERDHKVFNNWTLTPSLVQQFPSCNRELKNCLKFHR
jgi:hypothetical protein